MKLATTTRDFCEYSTDGIERSKYVREAGFRYIDYCFHIDYATRMGTFSENADKYVDDCLKLADKLSFSYVQAHAPMGDPIKDGTVNMDFVRETARSVEYASKLGIKNIVVHSDSELWFSKKQFFEVNREFYMRVFDIAENFGVHILTENSPRTETYYRIDNVEDLCEFVDYVNHPMFHVCWDTGHGNLRDVSPDEVLRILGNRVWGIHVQDNMGDCDSHLAPFCGNLNLDSLMHGLLDIDFKGYFTFESTGLFSYQKIDGRLAKVPLELRVEAEKLLYKTGEYILSSYGCFEE